MNKKDKDEVKQLIHEAVQPLVEHIYELTRLVSTLSELSQAHTETSISQSDVIRKALLNTGYRREIGLTRLTP